MTTDEETRPPCPACPSCGTTTCPDGFLELWDGKQYCVACIRAASPRLLERARSESVLQEPFRYPAWKVGGIWAIAIVVVWSCCMLILPLIALVHDDLELLESIQLWACLSGFALVVSPLIWLLSGVGYTLNRPSVSVEFGEVTVTQRNRSETVALRDCEWYVGKMSHMDMLRDTSVLPWPAVILVLPPDEKRLARNVAVGITEGTREIWQAFLCLAKTPQRTAWPTQGRVPFPLKFLAWSLAVPVGFVAFLLIGRLVSLLLSLIFADPDLCQEVGMLVFVDGFISAILYAAVGRPWHTSRLVPTRRSAKQQRTLRLVTMFGFVCVATPFSLASFVEDQSTPARVAGVVLSYAWALLIGYDLGRRAAKYEWAYARPAERDR
jgi:hypothetical protein